MHDVQLLCDEVRAMTEPCISCIMPTYGRPDYLNEALWCFAQQDYPNKELIVLNDCEGQEFHCDFPGVRVFNVAKRFKSLGEKRNAAIELAQGKILVVWDDDDISLPWRLSHSWSEMIRYGTPFYRPAEFLAFWGKEKLHDNQSVSGWVSHGTAAFTKSLWRQVGGYPLVNLGEDASFFKRIHLYLREEFIKFPIASIDRFYILRGASEYHHMSMSGGSRPLDTQPGVHRIVPREGKDVLLWANVKRICEERERLRSTDIARLDIDV